MICRAKKTAWLGSTPNDTGLVATAGLERPDAGGAPFQRSTPHVMLFVSFRLRRIGGNSKLLPARRCRAVKFDAKMPVVESRITSSIARIGQRDGNVVSEEIHGRDLPISVATNREKPLAGRNEKLIAHHQPPD